MSDEKSNANEILLDAHYHNHEEFKSFYLPGYVLDEQLLKRIDDSAQRLLVGRGSEEGINKNYNITDKRRVAITFNSLGALLEYLDSELFEAESINLTYSSRQDADVQVDFMQGGIIRLLAYSKSPDFNFNVQRLKGEIERCGQSYSFAIKAFIFSGKTIKLLKSAIFYLSIFLLANIVFYIYARSTGVDIDPSILPSGNAYFAQVEQAIKSEDLTNKLNVLLMGHLRYFTNVSDILTVQGKMMFYTLITISITLVILSLHWVINRLYPLSFFSFGYKKNELSSLYRKRDFWGIAVVIGFIINIVAGLIITVITLN